MIDTDKYEGFTGKQWNIEPNGWQIYAYGHINICRMDSPYSADAQLVADAPLLLAEVERLRGIAKTCLEAIEAGGDTRSGTIELIEHNLKLMEMIE